MYLTDLRHAAAALDTDDPAVLLQAWDEAARIIGEHRDDVDLIADALQRTARIDGEDLLMIWSAGG